MAKLGLQSPWVYYYGQINALFGRDPEIKVVYDNDTTTIAIFVDNDKKAAAIAKILPETKEFGNITVNVNVIPSNGNVNVSDVTIEDAFAGNPNFKYIRSFPDVFTNPICYVVMSKEILQWYTDDLSDLFGNANWIPADLAKSILINTSGNFFCTDIQ